MDCCDRVSAALKRQAGGATEEMATAAARPRGDADGPAPPAVGIEADGERILRQN